MAQHYEVTAAAMGWRIGSVMSEETALEAVRRKGTAGLNKLKARHVGPTHAYSQGTAEMRLLTQAAKKLVAVHRLAICDTMPKFESEHL